MAPSPNKSAKKRVIAAPEPEPEPVEVEDNEEEDNEEGQEEESGAEDSGDEAETRTKGKAVEPEKVQKKEKGGNPSKARVTSDMRVVEQLTQLYTEKLLPIERKFLFHRFHAPEILPSELAAKPQVLLLGQYSTGKTTFIRHLIDMDYPGIHIGPEPTTDKFIAVVHGDRGQVIKGNSLTAVADLPFSGMSTFGSSFLNKFEAAVVSAPLLSNLTIIDTPGVLSGEKQRISRGYDFARVCRWFAERSDLILLLFDSYKLDISDEFKGVIEELHSHDDKVHCVLNKADQLDSESLMRVYGALLWSMGKIFRGAEVTRVYVGSFHDKPLLRPEYKNLFDRDRHALMEHLKELPNMCSMRKVNEMVKRIRLNIVNVCLVGAIKARMPWFIGKEAAQKKILGSLGEIYAHVQHEYNLSPGDFPPIEDFRNSLKLQDFSTFPSMDRQVVQELKNMLDQSIPQILRGIAGVSKSQFAKDSEEDEVEGAGDDEKEAVKPKSIKATPGKAKKRSEKEVSGSTKAVKAGSNIGLVVFIGLIVLLVALAVGVAKTRPEYLELARLWLQAQGIQI